MESCWLWKKNFFSSDNFFKILSNAILKDTTAELLFLKKIGTFFLMNKS